MYKEKNYLVTLVEIKEITIKVEFRPKTIFITHINKFCSNNSKTELLTPNTKFFNCDKGWGGVQ